MSTILEMIYLRFKAFESTVRKVSVLSFNCIFFGNSTIQCFIYIFSSAAPVQFPCLGSMFQLLLASIFNTYLSSLEQVSNALHWHFSYSYRLFFGGERWQSRGLLKTFVSCQHVQNLSMEKHSFWWIMNENLKVYFSLVNKRRHI